MTKAAIYLRQSLDASGLGAAVGRQREDCQRLCEQRGLDVVAEFVDNDVSASLGRRPAYENLLTALRARQFDAIVAWHMDRLYRRPIELEALIELEPCIVTMSEVLDLGHDSGRMIARVLVSVARGEVERKSTRQRRANEQKAKAGLPPGGYRPFGYDEDYVTVRPEEASAIRRAYSQLLSGASLRSIAREWNDAGFRTAKGGEWQPYSVRDRLKNARYAGLREYRGEVVAKAQWEPIVEEATWRAAVALLTQPSRRTTPGNTRKYLLSGFARCGKCNALMQTGRTQHGKRTYTCSAAKHLALSAQPIDDLVESLALARLKRPDAADLLVEADEEEMRELQERRDELFQRKEALAQMFAAGAIDRDQLVAGTESLRSQIESMSEMLQASPSAPVLRSVVGEDVDAAWQLLDVHQRRAVIDVLMDVTLHSPGRGKRTFDPRTVQVSWKG